MTIAETAAQLLGLPDAETRRAFLAGQRAALTVALIQELKAEADSWLLRDTQRALQIANIAQEAAEFVGEPLATAVAQWAAGNALLYLGEYELCLSLYRAAAAVHADCRLPVEAARLRTNAVFLLSNLSRYDEALAEANLARRQLEPLGATRYLATLEQNVGVAYRHLGRHAEALASYDRARAIFEALGEEVKVAELDINRARVLENLDDFRQALALLETVQPVLEAHQQHVTAARADLNRGTLLARLGRYWEALAAYNQARIGFASLDNAMEVTVVDIYRARVYLALNLLPEALELASAARETAAIRRMPRQAAVAVMAQAAAWRGLGELDRAAELFDEARQIWTGLGAEAEIVLLDMERPALWRAQGRIREALALASAVAAQLEQREMPIRAAQARLVAAECAADLGDLAEAEQWYAAIAQAPAVLALPYLTYRCHFGSGRIAEARGDLEAAVAFYRQSVAEIEAMQRSLRIDDLKASFLDDKQDIYRALVRALLDMGYAEEAFAVVERAKSGVLLDFLAASLEARDLGDQETERDLWTRLQALKEEWQWHADNLAGGEIADDDPGPAQRCLASGEGPSGSAAAILRRIEAESRETWWKLQDVAHALFMPIPTAASALLAQVQESLADDTVLLQYFTLDGRLIAFVVTRCGLRVIRDFPCSLAEIERSLAVLELTLKGASSLDPAYVSKLLEPACRAHLGWLHRALVAPLADAIAPFPRLIVVPDGVLHYAPFHALYDGQQYLIERHQVLYLPAAALLASEDVACPTGAGQQDVALVMGYSDGGRLPFVVSEAEAVAAALPEAHLFTEKDARLSHLRTYGGACRVLHLATHGVFRHDNPLFSYLALADEPLRLLDVYGLRLHVRLAVLSACETGLSRAAGSDLIGLCRGFLGAGVRSLVLSLWRVDDAETAELMGTFYRELAAGQTPGAALRSAQLRMLRKHPHPYYWAPFVAVAPNEGRIL